MSVNHRPFSYKPLAADQPLPQLRPPPPRPASLDRNSERLPLPDQHDEALAACHPRVDQVPLQHRVVLRRQRDDHSRVFRALALVDGRRIGQHQLIQLTKAVSDVTAVEIDAKLPFLHVDARHDAEIAVVDVVVVIILDLNDLVARAECPAEALDADLARRVQRVLQLDIERASTEAATVHRAEHLDVAYRVQSETFGYPVLHNHQELSNTLFRIRRVDEVEVPAFGKGEIGHQTVVDPVRIDDDPALGGLPEDLGQAHDRGRSRHDDVAENLPRTHRRQLIDITDEQQRRAIGQSPKDRPHQRHVDHRGLVDHQEITV